MLESTEVIYPQENKSLRWDQRAGKIKAFCNVPKKPSRKGPLQLSGCVRKLPQSLLRQTLGPHSFLF